MKYIKYIFLLGSVMISLYILLTEDFTYTPVTLILLGLYFALYGKEQYKIKGIKSWAMFHFPVSILMIILGILS